jgi:hypothetical protein
MSELPLESGKESYTRAELVAAIESKDAYYAVRIKNQLDSINRLLEERQTLIAERAAIWIAGWKDGNDWAMYEERRGPGDYRDDPKNPYDGSDPR